MVSTVSSNRRFLDKYFLISIRCVSDDGDDDDDDDDDDEDEDEDDPGSSGKISQLTGTCTVKSTRDIKTGHDDDRMDVSTRSTCSRVTVVNVAPTKDVFDLWLVFDDPSRLNSHPRVILAGK